MNEFSTEFQLFIKWTWLFLDFWCSLSKFHNKLLVLHLKREETKALICILVTIQWNAWNLNTQPLNRTYFASISYISCIFNITIFSILHIFTSQHTITNSIHFILHMNSNYWFTSTPAGKFHLFIQNRFYSERGYIGQGAVHKRRNLSRGRGNFQVTIFLIG